MINEGGKSATNMLALVTLERERNRLEGEIKKPTAELNKIKDAIKRLEKITA